LLLSTNDIKPRKEGNMTGKKLKKLILFVLCVFMFSLIYTFIDNHTNYESAWTFGYSAGRNFKHFIKVFGSLALILLAYRNFKTNRLKNNASH